MRQDRIQWLASIDMTPLELAAGLLVLAMCIGALIAPTMTMMYRRRITRLMSMQQLRAPTAAWVARCMGAASSQAPCEPASTAAELDAAMQQRLSRIRRATLVAYLAFVASSSLALLVHTYSSFADSASKLIGAAALAAAPSFLNTTPRKSVWWIVAATIALMVVAGMLEKKTGPDDASDILVGLILVVGFAVVGAHRRWRALFIPLTLLAFAFIAGIAIATWIVLPGTCAGSATPANGDSLPPATMVLITAFAAIVAWAGARFVGLIARGYEHGWFSDVSLSAGFALVMFAGLLCFTGDRPGVGLAKASAIWFAWSSLTIAAYVLSLRLMRAPRVGRSLLVLRVFSRDRHTERLLDAVQTRWRYAGPVLQIGGPDLAALNIDPHEFARYLGGTEHELFIPGDIPAQQLATCLDLTPDREGRFHINEVFCFDTAWRSTVESLMGMADAIVLDVRGFTAERRGTGFEIELLRRMQRMHRVVMIGDKSTDWTHVDSLVGANAGGTRIDGNVADLDEVCLRALREVATQPGGGVSSATMAA